MDTTCPTWLALALASAHSYKWANWVTRVTFACLMALTFSIIIYLGPLALVVLILLVQVKCFAEVTTIGHKHYAPITSAKVKNVKITAAGINNANERWFGIRTWTWYLLVTSNYFFLTEFLSSYSYSNSVNSDNNTTSTSIGTSATFIKGSTFNSKNGNSNNNSSRNSTDLNLDHLTDLILSVTLEYHRIISFTLYLVAILWFVLLDNNVNHSKEDANKNVNGRKEQGTKNFFSIFAFTHVALLILVAPSYLIIQNLNHGLIWFIVPVSMVNWNDAMAYLCGSFWGRRPLIQVSPKKTWEGFVGGGIATVAFGAFLSYVLCQYPYLLCPLPLYEISPAVSCSTVPSLFTAQAYHIEMDLNFLHFFGILNFLGPDLPWKIELEIIPFVLHSLSLSVFTSIIGPFGGFFASGFKRAFQIKDFGHVIPGHGGVLDRFDCQFLMATFVNVYITTFISGSPPGFLTSPGQSTSSSAEEILHQALTYLDSPEQIKFVNSLQQHLTQRGLLQIQGGT